MSGRRGVRLIALPAAIALLALGCSDGDGGSTEAFCERVEELDRQDEPISLDDPDGFEEFQTLVDDAPGEVKEPLETIEAKVSDLEGLDEDDPAAFGEAFSLVFDPDFVAAIRDVGVFARDECGVQIEGLEELEQFDPQQLEEDLGDLGGDLEDFGNELQEDFDDLEQQFEEDLGTVVPDTSAPG